MLTDVYRSRMMISYIETMNDKDYIVSINGKSMNAYIYPIDDCIRIDMASAKIVGEMMNYLFDMKQDK